MNRYITFFLQVVCCFALYSCKPTVHEMLTGGKRQFWYGYRDSISNTYFLCFNKDGTYATYWETYRGFNEESYGDLFLSHQWELLNDSLIVIEGDTSKLEIKDNYLILINRSIADTLWKAEEKMIPVNYR